MNEEKKYNVIYAGAIANGFEEHTVKASFVSELKIPIGKVDKLFNGRRVVLKKAINKSQAERWQRKLADIGAETAVIPFVDAKKEVDLFKAASRNSIAEKLNPSFSETNLGKPTITQDESSDFLNADDKTNPSDKEMEERVRRAKAMIAEQQISQSLSNSSIKPTFDNLVKFLIVLAVLVGFLYFYADLAV